MRAAVEEQLNLIAAGMALAVVGLVQAPNSNLVNLFRRSSLRQTPYQSLMQNISPHHTSDALLYNSGLVHKTNCASTTVLQEKYHRDIIFTQNRKIIINIYSKSM